LSCRPLTATVADTWTWLESANAGSLYERAAEIGISMYREQRILAGVT
jgi:hypothetical protein